MKTKIIPEGSYTDPQISTSNPKDWFVWFRFYYAGKWHPVFKLREDLNRIKNKAARMKEAVALRDARHSWLKEGWNPVTDREYKMRNVRLLPQKKAMSVMAALKFGLSVKKIAKKSRLGYSSQLNIIEQAAIKHGFSGIEIKNFDRGLFLDLMGKVEEERIKVEGEFSNHSWNKYAATMRAMLTELVDQRVIDVNPLRDLRTKPVPESNKYERFTEDDKRDISAFLLANHFNLYRVMQVVYHAGIRPKEALALRISDVDMKRRMITIAPDEVEENSKTLSLRHVPINPHLYDLLNMLALHKFPDEYFVFGSPFQPGKGNRGAGSQQWFDGISRGVGKKTGKSGAMRDDFLTPSAVQASRDTITKLWKKLIIDTLGIKKHLYAAKHTGGRDMVRAGLKLTEIQLLYGHESPAMTKLYTEEVALMEVEEAVLKKAPSFNAPLKPIKGKLRKVS
ncbi:site-specific integrase [Terrimonas sp. NA20]|uniref:Site-specific integrase n=1 Tax=Terrimonas ginsenosidimutans TaxID=2908004 RepID=A0ABS9KRI4_9BACT|nr:site-specific integrase [Terrimonas ginsenosidimutans]MCG2614919.1 site-specific integrase [Terrimonas ginsenosidimutans]